VVVLFGLAAVLAALGCGITAFLEKLLIRGRECKILPAVATRKLKIFCHGTPLENCTLHFAKSTK
jgi:hypothetical protein